MKECQVSKSDTTSAPLLYVLHIRGWESCQNIQVRVTLPSCSFTHLEIKRADPNNYSSRAKST